MRVMAGLVVCLLAVAVAGAAGADGRLAGGGGSARAAVDRAVRARTSAPVRKLLDATVRRTLDRAIRDVRTLEDYPDGDLGAMRLHAQAYGALTRFVEQLLAAARTPVGEAADAAATQHDRICVCDCPACDEDGGCPPCTCVCTGFPDACPATPESLRIE